MSSLAVFEVAMCVNVYDKSSLKIRKKRENMESKKFYINLHLKDRLLQTKFTACQSELMPEKALTSFT